jgi:hypothetical protein
MKSGRNGKDESSNCYYRIHDRHTLHININYFIYFIIFFSFVVLWYHKVIVQLGHDIQIFQNKRFK